MIVYDNGCHTQNVSCYTSQNECLSWRKEGGSYKQVIFIYKCLFSGRQEEHLETIVTDG